MWCVRFGNQESRTGEIVERIDSARFQCGFGDLREADFSKFDCVVPLVLSDYKALEENKDLWGTKFWSPSRKIVELCDDKLALNRVLLDGEFAELVPALGGATGARRLPFPYILKKRRDEYGENCFIVRNSDDELTIAEKLESPEYFTQAYVPGSEEFALHALVANGELKYAQTVKYEFIDTVYAKGKYFDYRMKRRTFLSENEHVALFSRMLLELGYTGTCCVDFKLDDGKPRLLEINPRVGATLTRDINRYLEAYLGSLGLMDKRDFCHAETRPAQDKFIVRTRMWLRSYMPDGPVGGPSGC